MHAKGNVTGQITKRPGNGPGRDPTEQQAPDPVRPRPLAARLRDGPGDIFTTRPSTLASGLAAARASVRARLGCRPVRLHILSQPSARASAAGAGGSRGGSWKDLEGVM